MPGKFCISIDLLLSLILLAVREIKVSGEDFLENKTYLLPPYPSKKINSPSHSRENSNALISTLPKVELSPLCLYLNMIFVSLKKIEMQFFYWVTSSWLAKFKDREERTCLSISSTCWRRVIYLVIIFTCVICDLGTANSGPGKCISQCSGLLGTLHSQPKGGYFFLSGDRM